MKNRILVLSMSALCLAPVCSAKPALQDAQDFVEYHLGVVAPDDVEMRVAEFKEQAAPVVAKLQEQAAPVVAKLQEAFAKGGPAETVVMMVRDGKFEELRAYLKARPELLNMVPAVMLVRDNITKIKQPIVDALNQLPVDMIPTSWQEKVASAKAEVLKNLGAIDQLKAELNKQVVMDYANLNADKIVDALTMAANSKEYGLIKENVQAFYNYIANELVPQLKALDFKKIGAALENIYNYQQGKGDLSLELVVPVLGQIRRTSPLVFAFLAKTFDLMLIVNDKLTVQAKLPEKLTAVVQTVKNNATQVKQVLDTINQEITKALEVE